MKPLFFLSLGAILCCAACKKNNHGSDFGIKITVIAGNNQRDTVGKVLPDSVRVKVTRGGLSVPNAALKIVRPGCAYSLTNFGITGADGTGAFQWQLNATIGTQEMELYVMDSVLGAVDSTTAMATGTFADHVWLPANCVPQFSNAIQTFGLLPSGRVLYSPSNEAYYSDDNGATWSVLSSFPGQSGPNNFAVNGNDIFVWSGTGAGVLYSTDAAATWQLLPTSGIVGQIYSLAVTRSSNLFASTSGGEYRSTDLGHTWTNISNQQNSSFGFEDFYGNFCEAADGTMFTAGDNGDLWISQDSGVSWAKTLAVSQAVGVFSDSSGTIYVSYLNGLGGGLSRMDKSGSSYLPTPLCSFQAVNGNEPAIRMFSVMKNSFYFMLDGYGLMETTDFSTILNLTGQPISGFCITKTGAGIISGLAVYDFPILYNLHP